MEVTLKVTLRKVGGTGEADEHEVEESVIAVLEGEGNLFIDDDEGEETEWEISSVEREAVENQKFPD